MSGLSIFAIKKSTLKDMAYLAACINHCKWNENASTCSSHAVWWVNCV